MEDVMVTGRMSAQKKAAGNAVLKDAGLNPSQAINLMYSKLVDEKDASFLTEEGYDPIKWKVAAKFVDSLVVPQKTRFDNMTKAEIKMDRLRSRGLVK